MIPYRTLAKWIGIAAVLALATLYVGDFVSVHIRMRHPKPNDPFETITALRLLAIGEKGNKTEYAIDQVQPQQTGVCVHSIFPHGGDPPCWYLKRKFAQPIPMNIFWLPTLESRTAYLLRRESGYDSLRARHSFCFS